MIHEKTELNETLENAGERNDDIPEIQARKVHSFNLPNYHHHEKKKNL